MAEVMTLFFCSKEIMVNKMLYINYSTKLLVVQHILHYFLFQVMYQFAIFHYFFDFVILIIELIHNFK